MATLTGLGRLKPETPRSTSETSFSRSISSRPHPGHEISSIPLFLIPRDLSMFIPTTISSTGSPVKDTLIVSPIPSARSAPIPMADFTVPIPGVPASVTPRWSGYSVLSASILYAVIIFLTSVDLTEIFMSRKSRSSSMRTCLIALSTRASAVGCLCFLSMSFSREPEFTPILMGILLPLQASTTAFILYLAPMFPGFILIPSTPCLIDSRASL